MNEQQRKALAALEAYLYTIAVDPPRGDYNAIECERAFVLWAQERNQFAYEKVMQHAKALGYDI